MATDYERKRLENIKRNNDLLASLNVHATASLLSSATKRSRDDESSKPSKTKKFTKKKKPEEPLVIRQSLRTRGKNPDSKGLPDGFSDKRKVVSFRRNESVRVLGPLSFGEVYEGEGCSYSDLVDSIEKTGNVVEIGDDVVNERIDFEGGFDKVPLRLEEENVGRVVPERILVVKFLPLESLRMVIAGDKSGNVGFWNLDCDDNDENDGIYLFRPHIAPVSSLVFQQNSFSKVISSSYDGLIRMMDVEKMVFDLVYSGDEDEAIFSLSQRPNDEQSLYFGEGNGMFKVWDIRAGKSSFEWDLHEKRINTIDFNPQNPHVMATSSTDGTACLWDLRSMGAKKPKTLKIVNHAKAVHSAYFSPSGLMFATTSPDNYIGIHSGANVEDTNMIYHINSTNRWISSFRGVWGWDDSYIFVGNLAKRIDVIAPKLRRTVMELHDPLMKAIPCRIHCHPLNVGMLGGATAGGQVYVWTPK